MAEENTGTPYRGNTDSNQIPVGPVVPGHHPDLPESVALLPDHAEDPPGGPLHLPPGVPAPGTAPPRRRRGPGPPPPRTGRAPDSPGRGSFLHTDCQCILLHKVGPSRRASSSRVRAVRRAAVKMPPSSSPSRGPQVRVTVRLSACPMSRASTSPLLGGEVGKAVQPQVLSLGPGAVRQLLRHPGEPVPGVQGAPGGQLLIGAADEAQVPELVPLGAARLLPRPDQLFRGDAGLPQLVPGGQQGLEKGGPPGGPGHRRRGPPPSPALPGA